MEMFDKNYLRLQFQSRAFQKHGSEYQKFFEDIIQKAYPDFRKIKPHGNQGDEGNDGYIPSEGIYFQVYSPEKPDEKELDAIKKCQKDFIKLKRTWDEINKINKYYFVFNNRGSASTIGIETMLMQLKKENSDIDFELFTTDKLEKVFLDLTLDEFRALGFDVDSTKALKIANDILIKIESSLDNESGEMILQELEKYKDVLLALNNEQLEVTYEILEAKALRKSEKIVDAISKYEKLRKKYPYDARPILYLAEIYLIDGDYQKNEELLNEAEGIDSASPLLALEKILRELRLGNKDDISIDEGSFPIEPRMKSKFYRIHSILMENSGNQSMATSFIERAIALNPNDINNYIVKLSIQERSILTRKNNKETLKNELKKLLLEIEVFEQKFKFNGLGLPSRINVILKKIGIYYVHENFNEVEKLAKECFELLLQCYFNKNADELLCNFLQFVALSDHNLGKITEYIEKSGRTISNKLANAILLQFVFKGNLLTKGREFYQGMKVDKICAFIDSIEKADYDKAYEYIKNDLELAISVANLAKKYPELRMKIIEKLPDNEDVQKNKLLLLLKYDEKKYDDALKILRKIDLNNLSVFESKNILEIAKEKGAWDVAIVILEKMMCFNKNQTDILQIKLDLTIAYFKLEKNLEGASFGEKILSNSNEMEKLNEHNKEALVWNVIVARWKRSEYEKAILTIEKYGTYIKNPKYKIELAEIYLGKQDADGALALIIEGVISIGNPTPEQFGSLIIKFIDIGNLIDLSIRSKEYVENNSFVKIQGQDMWYFVGDDVSLNATRITSNDLKYPGFINKKIGEKLLLNSKYSADKNEYIIENIVTLRDYIHSQCRYWADTLTSQNRWEVMQKIDVPITGDTIDTTNLVAYFEDDRKSRNELYEFYCNNEIPLACLAIITGGIERAIGYIVNEGKGFVKFSSNLEDVNAQIEIAKKILCGSYCYLDGTTAFILIESGLFEEVYANIPNLKVPQSVIAYLFRLKKEFEFHPGQLGRMIYSKGQIIPLPVDREGMLEYQTDLEKTIKLLETKPNNIGVVSEATKTPGRFDQKTPPEISDACILAKKENTFILSEDYLYLKFNAIEVGEDVPNSCSAFALIRTLYQLSKITFDQYLAFYHYLALRQFRFLPIYYDDLKKAIFGDGRIMLVRPENIKKFKFSLTLSAKYGVSFNRAFSLMVKLIVEVLSDDSIIPEVVDKIFQEILNEFPTEISKRALGEMLLTVAKERIKSVEQNITIGIRINEKYNKLSQILNAFGMISYL